MVRVRYTKNAETGLMSTAKILAGNDYVVVTLNPTTNSYTITAYQDATVLHQGTAKTLPAVKRAAKEQLAAMGVNFEDEVRAKKAVVETVELPKVANG